MQQLKCARIGHAPDQAYKYKLALEIAFVASLVKFVLEIECREHFCTSDAYSSDPFSQSADWTWPNSNSEHIAICVSKFARLYVNSYMAIASWFFESWPKRTSSRGAFTIGITVGFRI